MSKYLIDKYKRELKSYTFSQDKYDNLMNVPPKKNEVFNESFNRNVFINTPKDCYLKDGKIIYYGSLREVDSHINVWIESFCSNVRFTDDNLDIYSYYVMALNKIREEITSFAKMCSTKYDLKFAIGDSLYSTLVKTYISILWERKLKINNRLRIILESEFKLYYTDLGSKLLKLYDIYSTIILSNEEENEDFYIEFKDSVRKLIEEDKKKIKIREAK